MAVPSQPLPTIGQPNTSEDPRIRSALSELQTILTGGGDVTNLSNATLQLLGLTNGAQIGRGKSIISTSESRTNVAYGLMTTPDRVSGLVLPTDGLIFAAYHATWQSSVASAGQAAFFLGATQVQQTTPTSGALLNQGTTTGGLGAAMKGVLYSHNGGLLSYIKPSNGSAAVGYPGDTTTGQILGAANILYQDQDSADGMGGAPNSVSTNFRGAAAPAVIFAAAGTYDFSVRFLASSGSVTVENRHLWVWTMGF